MILHQKASSACLSCCCCCRIYTMIILVYIASIMFAVFKWIIYWHACNHHNYKLTSYWWMMSHLVAAGLLDISEIIIWRAQSCTSGLAGEPAASCVDMGSVCFPSLCKSTAFLEWGGAHTMAEFRLAWQCCLHCSPLPSENSAAEFILLPFCLSAIPFIDCLYREMPKWGQRGQEMLLSGMCSITFSSNFDTAL